MGSWQQIRKDSPPAAPAAPVAEIDTGRLISMFEVEPATVTVLGDNEFLPPAYRGLEVYHPTPNWDLAGRAPMGSQPRIAGSSFAVARPASPCHKCGCVLSWEPIGDPHARCCVQCDPPSPKLAENLWVAENENCEVCVSTSYRWKQAAFQEFERLRRSRARLDAVIDTGF